MSGILSLLPQLGNMMGYKVLRERNDGKLGVGKMRLFYLSSGCGFTFNKELADEDQAIILGLRQLSCSLRNFRFSTFLIGRESNRQLLRRIRAFSPDVILAFRGMRISSDKVREIKRKVGVPIGIWVVDDPYRLQTHATLTIPYDFVVTQDAASLPFYQKRGKPCVHVPLAYNEEKYVPAQVPSQYHSDLCFIGSGFPARLHVFDQLAPFLREKKFILIGQWWEKLKHYNALRTHIYNRPIPPTEVMKYYNGAKIVLNIHRTRNDRKENLENLPAVTPNSRTFEIAACRSFQLATWRRGLQNYYRIGEEIISYRGVHDLREKIEYYLPRQKERVLISSAGYMRTQRDHRYKHRLRTLLAFMEQYAEGKKR
ncbi:glycosyltransferase [Mechercharimyces sp. CAU 1602]|uniref:CgeB family protein n=1 Tax=Mechercharimyces sp. CAU 1602 TaxID=2973933 RepID=UPI002161FC92|nr:glycosyltransferase [Mechercharimyces sp. CAU 1602]MCS1351115.1 glycosyltransferase [Mechercharimyces sp. CAU 1602]